MPDTRTHLAQAQRDSALSTALVGIDQPEWAIVALFFSALHLVDAYLAQRKEHPSTHDVRGRLVRREAVLRNVYTRYSELKDRSEDVRYKCLHFNLQQVDDYRQMFYEPLSSYIRGRITAQP